MRPFIAAIGLVLIVAGAAPAPPAPPGAAPDAFARGVVHAASSGTPGADPYAALQHCRQEVRSFLALRTGSRSQRMRELEACIAGAERRAHVEIATGR